MRKGQSAIEYLTTYGWAILIIVIVLGLLYWVIGATTSTTPKAMAGSCQVSRNGPEASFVGVCSSEQPQFVSSFSSTGYISANVVNMPTGSKARTLTGWFYVSSESSGGNVIASYGSTPSTGNAFITYVKSTNQLVVTLFGNDQVASSAAASGTWYFFAEQYSGTTLTGYFGNAGVLSSNSAALSANTPSSSLALYIATNSTSPGRNGFSGYIANIQLYNTTLSAADIRTLYLEGIGGVPLSLQNLVGWWPLNGNANDYSGNGYNGNSVNVGYTSQWSRGYTVP